MKTFGLTTENTTQIDDRTFLVKKWNWDYKEAHAFQKFAHGEVSEKNHRYFIVCNHPRVLTHGRGLQKPRKGEVLSLIDFKPEHFPNLPFPLHQIERGGGLTYHHPGQFIFYPIVKLNPHNLSLSKMVDGMLDVSIDILTDWGVSELHHENKLLGLWKGEKKLASVGFAIEKLITFHGMALNMFQDPEMKYALKALNPCGLETEIYSSVEDWTPLPPTALDDYAAEFTRRIFHVWK